MCHYNMGMHNRQMLQCGFCLSLNPNWDGALPGVTLNPTCNGALPYTINPKWGGALPAGAGAEGAGSGVGAGGREHAACCIRGRADGG